MQLKETLIASEEALKRAKVEESTAKAIQQARDQMFSSFTTPLNTAIEDALINHSKNAGHQFAMSLAQETGNALLNSIEKALEQALANSAIGSAFSGILGAAAGGNIFSLVFHAVGIPGFAVGAWELPGDMVAQVHKGEVIVPAGPAAAMRDALSGGAASSGPGGQVSVEHNVHFHVSAIDSGGVKQFFKDNSKHILGAINEGVRTGSHLGLSKLGKV